MSQYLPPVIREAIQRERQQRAERAFSPIEPYLPEPGAELHRKQAAQLDAVLQEARAWEEELLRDAHGVRYYLGWNYAELCEESKRIPARLRTLATFASQRHFDPTRLLDLAERVFGLPVPGKSQLARVARVLDARYWRRVLWKRIGQSKEQLHLKLGLLAAVQSSGIQLQRNYDWVTPRVLTVTPQGTQVYTPRRLK